MFLDEESAAIIAAAVNELRQFDPLHDWRARDVETFWRACIKEINRRNRQPRSADVLPFKPRRSP
jgi:hypothetical protein